MPVIIEPTEHPARECGHVKVSKAHELLEESCPQLCYSRESLIQNSFPRRFLRKSHILPSQHGFVYAIMKAYSDHQKLIIRPEDVWFSILVQLGFFVKSHAVDLRAFFVTHRGQKELGIVKTTPMATADFGQLAVEMTTLIEENVVDKELRDWIMPDFTTTTECDKVVAAILMMGALKKYFSYKTAFRCGIPSVTLLGDRKDWESMVKKLDKIYRLGDEPARFAQLLRPVLNYFLLSFDRPDSPEVNYFWKRCAHRSSGSGIPSLTGWASVFCFWDEEGNLAFSEPIHPVSSSAFESHNTELGLKDVLARHVDSSDLPSGYACVPVTLDDHGEIHHTMMIAGMVGIQVTSSAVKSGIEGDKSLNRGSEDAKLDSLQPLSGWWMYEKDGARRRVTAKRRRWMGPCSIPRLIRTPTPEPEKID